MNNETQSAVLSTPVHFSWIEYTTFGSLLGLSAVIGMYFGWYKGNQNSFEEYILGGRNMKLFPIAISLIASHISGITLIGLPAEAYEFGTQMVMGFMNAIFVAAFTNKFFVPIFFDLQLHSLYAYLELRFSKSVRLLASFIYLLSFVMHTPIIIYIPALAFHQVTGVSVHFITPIICFLCIFYTTIGGLKAVVWTDAIQSVFTLGSILVVIGLGVIDVGGLTRIIEINSRGQRFEFFNLDTNVYSRASFWNVMLGITFLHITQLTIHPGSTQRFAALPSKKEAKRSVIGFFMGTTVIMFLSGFVGLIIYAKYWNCDPIKSQNMKTSAKLLPYFVQEITASFPGLTGIFISGIVSTALSTMSAGLNTMAGTLYEDFVAPLSSKPVSETKSSFIMKIIVVVLGCLCVALVYLVEKLGPIMQMAMSLGAAANSALFTAFVLGVFFPWSNKKGVLIGMTASLLLTLWMVIGAQLATFHKELIFVGKPTDTTGCLTNITLPLHPSQLPGYEEIARGVFAKRGLFFLYKISFLYYIPIGSVTGMIVGLLSSLCLQDSNAKNVNPNLVIPAMRRFLKENNHSNGKYDSIAQDLNFDLKELNK